MQDSGKRGMQGAREENSYRVPGGDHTGFKQGRQIMQGDNRSIC